MLALRGCLEGAVYFKSVCQALEVKVHFSNSSHSYFGVNGDFYMQSIILTVASYISEAGPSSHKFTMSRLHFFFFFPSESQTPRVIEKRTRSYELELALVSNFLYLNNNNKPQILDQVLCLEVAVGMYKKIHSSRHCMFPAYLFSLLPINITWFLLEKQHCLFSSPEFLVAKPG